MNLWVDIASDLAEGLQAYAQAQGDLQWALKEHFCTIWQSPLTNSDDISELDGDSEDNGHADDDDNDDNDEECGLCYEVKRGNASRSGTTQNPQTPTPNLHQSKNTNHTF